MGFCLQKRLYFRSFLLSPYSWFSFKIMKICQWTPLSKHQKPFAKPSMSDMFFKAFGLLFAASNSELII
jgi:hypothetical protein